MYKSKHKVLFLFSGDLIKSHGTAAYVSSFLKYIQKNWAETGALFFQVHLPNGENGIQEALFPHLIKAPLTRIYPFIPRIIWRVYEWLYSYLRVGQYILQSGYKAGMTVFVCGECLLPVVWLCKAMDYRCIYIKMGIIEEFLMDQKKRGALKYSLIRFLERCFFKQYDAITVVSEKMGLYLQQKYGISATHVMILPCAVDQEVFAHRPESRLEIRHDLKLEGRLIFVYSGIWASWQCVNETIACFRLLKKLDERAFLLILSPDKDRFQQSLQDMDPEDYRILFIARPLMDRYLSAADCGFLIRKRHVVNQVASPLKFPEYLMCGLPLIIGPAVGDYTDVVRKEGIGVVIDPEHPAVWKKRLSLFLRQVATHDAQFKASCIRLAQTRFSWQAMSKRFCHLNNLLSEYSKKPLSYESKSTAQNTDNLWNKA